MECTVSIFLSSDNKTDFDLDRGNSATDTDTDNDPIISNYITKNQTGLAPEITDPPPTSSIDCLKKTER